MTALTIVATPAVALVAQQPAVVLAGAATVAGINHRFYNVLRRRGGLRLAFAGAGMHVLHHLAAVSAVPLGFVAHVRRGGATPLPAPITSQHADGAAVADEQPIEVSLASAA
jgi:hypothetical protein